MNSNIGKKHRSGGAFCMETIMEQNEKLEKLFALCAPAVEYLQQNFHPHTTVVIEVDGIRVEETLATKVIEYAVD